MRFLDRAFGGAVIAIALLGSASLGQLLPNGGQPMAPVGAPANLPTLSLVGIVVADGYSDGKASITSGTNVVSDSSRACKATDAGKVVAIAGAGISTATVSGGPYSITSGGNTGITVSGSQPPFWAVGGWVYDQTTGQGVGTAVSWSSGTLTIAGTGSYTVSTSDTLQFNFPLHSTITGCSGSSYLLADNASSSTTLGTGSAQWGFGTDNSAALASWAATNPNVTGMLPAGQILLDANPVALAQNYLEGAKAPYARTASFGSTGQFGTTFLLTSPTVKPFTLATSIRITGVNFFWPAQAGQAPMPVAYQPLFQPPNTSTAFGDIYIDHDAIINAYDVIHQPSGGAAWGNIHFENNEEYAVRYYWDVNNIAEEVFDTDNIHNPSVYAALASTTRVGTNYPNYLLTWSVANGDFIHATGNGVPGSTVPTYGIYGMNVVGGIINGVHRVIDLNNAWFDESHIANVDINGVGQMLYVDAGSIYRGTVVEGGLIAAGVSAGLYPNNAQATFDFEGTTTNNVASELQVDANVSSNTGQYVYKLNSGSLRTVNVHGQSVNYGVVMSGAAASSGGPWSITNSSNTTIAMSSTSPPSWWHTGMAVYDQNTGNTIGTTVSWSGGNLVVAGSGTYTVSNSDTLYFDVAAGNRYYAYVNAPNANVNFNGVNIYPSSTLTAGIQWSGVQLISAKTFQFTDSNCRSVYYCLDWSGFTSGTALIANNTSSGSTSTTTNNGSNTTSIAWGPNAWDKGDVPPWPLIVTNAASPYSFTVPAGAPLIDVWGIGAGGGGGGGALQVSSAACSGGSGGGAGLSTFFEFTAAELGGAGTTLTVTVPAGGAFGAAATSTGAGSPGSQASGSTTFGSYPVGYIGGEGAGGQLAGNSGGGAGASLISAGNNGSSGAAGGGPVGGANGGFGAAGGNATGLGGGSGGAGGVNGAAGVAGGNSASGATGGGAGGGVSAGNTAFAGGNGGQGPLGFSATGGAIGANGNNGDNPTCSGSSGRQVNLCVGGGGSGGGGNTGGSAAGAGKTGGVGAGGGGGGCGQNGSAAGAGGSGGPGQVIIWPRFI